jgi:hypothetical protein
LRRAQVEPGHAAVRTADAQELAQIAQTLPQNGELA